jgi:hypothetical protein
VAELRAGIFTSAGVAAGVVTREPLSQNNFLPFFTQVNFFPLVIDICPAFVQAAPDLTAAGAAAGRTRAKTSARATDAMGFFT